MEDRPHFEIWDGAVVHPLICPWPGLSPKEKAEIELARAWAVYLRGGGGWAPDSYPRHADYGRER
jgi:hypothetical protein